ncbi:MAG: hypothetical protein ACE5GO_09710 [Anaerolineales bacterium]
MVERPPFAPQPPPSLAKQSHPTLPRVAFLLLPPAHPAPPLHAPSGPPRQNSAGPAGISAEIQRSGALSGALAVGGGASPGWARCLAARGAGRVLAAPTATSGVDATARGASLCGARASPIPAILPCPSRASLN